jgi:integrase
VPRSSYVENIEQRWLESGALYAGRYTPILQFSARDDAWIVDDNLPRWFPRERNRYLDAGIFPKLNEACCQLTGFDGYYVPLIIFLAVETGLRVQELCGLKWGDVSLDKRRMEVAKPRWPEEHEARTVVLSVRVRWYLERVALALQKDDRFDPLNPVIPMTAPAVHKALKDVANRAQVQIDGLLFDALHREAEARFDEAGLTKAEKDVMLGSAHPAGVAVGSGLDSGQARSAFARWPNL